MFVTGPIPVLIVYDGVKKDRLGVKRRVSKRFANGLDRKAKEFYLEMARQGRYPVITDADRNPVFAPGSKYTGHNQPTPLSERHLTQGRLFDNPDEPPTNLPD